MLDFNRNVVVSEYYQMVHAIRTQLGERQFVVQLTYEPAFSTAAVRNAK